MKPTDGIKISNINFTGGLTTVSTASGAVPAYVLCGSDSCTGAWDWSSLRVCLLSFDARLGSRRELTGRVSFALQTTTPPTPGDLTPQKGVPITGVCSLWTFESSVGWLADLYLSSPLTVHVLIRTTNSPLMARLITKHSAVPTLGSASIPHLLLFPSLSFLSRVVYSLFLVLL